MNRQKDRQKGFTLIELLVVVAIIGILTAIALPNFLNAQTRAKVARAKVEIKTIVSGLEQYYVDNNAYPPYHYVGAPDFRFFIGGSVTSFNNSPPFDGRNPITTPIAYITSFPDDPFNRVKKICDEDHQYTYVNLPYAYVKVGWPVFADLYMVYGPYRLHSKGPDTEGPDTGLPYDPTNGVTSRGDILYAPRTGFVYVDVSYLDPNK